MPIGDLQRGLYRFRNWMSKYYGFCLIRPEYSQYCSF
jgi:hypothetical protein